MKNLEYKGYTGTIEYSKEDKLLFGKVIGVKSLLSYEGSIRRYLIPRSKMISLPSSQEL